MGEELRKAQVRDALGLLTAMRDQQPDTLTAYLADTSSPAEQVQRLLGLVGVANLLVQWVAKVTGKSEREVLQDLALLIQ